MRYVDWLCSNMKPIVYTFSQRYSQPLSSSILTSDNDHSPESLVSNFTI